MEASAKCFGRHREGSFFIRRGVNVQRLYNIKMKTLKAVELRLELASDAAARVGEKLFPPLVLCPVKGTLANPV